MTTRAEQETTVTYGRDETVVYIYSSIPAHMRRLTADPRVTVVDEHNFTVPRDAWRPIAFKSRRVMSDEQRQAAADRLRAAREARS